MRYVLIDRITGLDPGRSLTAFKNVSLSDDLVERVAPGVSALPAAMVLEAMAQAAGLLVIASAPGLAQPVLAKVQPFTAYGEAKAGDRIAIRAELDDVREEGARVRVAASVDGAQLAEATIVLALMPIDGPERDARVALMRARLDDTFPGWFDTAAMVSSRS